MKTYIDYVTTSLYIDAVMIMLAITFVALNMDWLTGLCMWLMGLTIVSWFVGIWVMVKNLWERYNVPAKNDSQAK